LRVAPNVLEEMWKEGLGKGVIGCMSMTPVSFVSEEEGVALVKAALEKAGLVLADNGPTIENVRVPVTSYNRGKDEIPPYKANPVAFTFDGASADGKVVFEFVSVRDFLGWVEKHGGVREPGDSDEFEFPTSRYYLSAAAIGLAQSLAKTKDGENRIAVIVFDPLETRAILAEGFLREPWYSQEKYPSHPANKGGGYNNDMVRKASEEDEAYQAELKTYKDELARRIAIVYGESIDRQLAPQIAYLREQGILPPVDTVDNWRLK